MTQKHPLHLQCHLADILKTFEGSEPMLSIAVVTTGATSWPPPSGLDETPDFTTDLELPTAVLVRAPVWRSCLISISPSSLILRA